MKENNLAEIFKKNGITYCLVENGFGEKYAELSGIWRELYCAKDTRYSFK